MVEEIVFQSMNEAFQMLADITGKKIMIPDKAEPVVASQAGADQIGDEIEDEEATNAEDPLEAIDKQITKLTDAKGQISKAIEGISQ